MTITKTRKLGLILAVALVSALMLFTMSGIAFAGYGPHGSFDKDTDACAGCHRAHTSVSGVSYTDNNGTSKSALLIGASTQVTVKSFCYTCHGPAAPGAATDVSVGMLDSTTSTVGNSVGGAPLNGGAFDEWMGVADSITSRHDMPDVPTGPGLAFGGLPNNDSAGGTRVSMDCSSCHDPHGSSNYRLLKDKIALGGGGYTESSVTVGGYDNFATFDPNPSPYVISNEQGYPLGGFRLHTPVDGSAPGVPEYKPDFTTARYARAPGLNPAKGISGWCAACHTEYNTTDTVQGAYNDGTGTTESDVARHRHPVNVALSNFAGDRSILTTNTATGMNNAWEDDVDIPLEHDPATEAVTTADPDNQTNTLADYIGCLTCHRAHGTNSEMSGYATGYDPYDFKMAQQAPTMGASGQNSALLRANNRGVCERCHNK